MTQEQIEARIEELNMELEKKLTTTPDILNTYVSDTDNLCNRIVNLIGTNEEGIKYLIK